MELETQNSCNKVWMVVEAGEKVGCNLVEVSAEKTNYTQHRLSFWHPENV